MLVCADKILGAAVDIRKVAASAAGDEDFLADAIGKLEDGDAASAFARFDCAEESRGSSAENKSIKIARQRNQALSKPHRGKLSLSSLLRVN